MHIEKWTEFDLQARLGTQATATALPAASDTAVDLMRVIEKLARSAEQDELSFISWKLTQLANDLVHTARRSTNGSAA
jgi:hypothetical protein